jgi:2-polyprenyl-6-methoxyphenol hydroxylase-like FAD-dependent oxidoreductase
VEGSGGLCLAQGLRKSGIAVTVYERDRSVHFRNQGYRLHINAYGSHALESCLPNSPFHLYQATSGEPRTGAHAEYDSQLNETFSRAMRPRGPDSSVSLSTEVNRLTLREILLHGLDDVVHFGKTFERFERPECGGVRAHFDDGATAKGDVLIGADGTGSVVRQLLLPDARLSEVGFAIYGKTLLTLSPMEWIPENLLNGFSRVVDADGVAMIFGSYRKREAFVEATAKHVPSLRLTETADYLMWTFRASFEQLGLTEQEYWQAAPAVLHAAASNLVKNWHPSLRRIVAESDIAATFSVRFRASDPVEPWKTTNVTLLGDAIHTMPPFRGVGANTALRDAELLRNKLLDVARNRTPILKTIADYETEMIRDGFEAVRHSVEAPLFGSQSGSRRVDSGEARTRNRQA